MISHPAGSNPIINNTQSPFLQQYLNPLILPLGFPITTTKHLILIYFNLYSLYTRIHKPLELVKAIFPTPTTKVIVHITLLNYHNKLYL